MNSQLGVAVLTYVILPYVELCVVRTDLLEGPEFETGGCFNVKEVMAGDHISPHVILLQGNVSDKSKCTQLTVRYRHLNHVGLNAFKGLINLSVIDLENNKISILKAEIFKDLKSLKELNLKKNCIKQVNKETFLGLIFLEKLNLQNNKISMLQNETFKYLISLKVLILDYNFVTELWEETFSGLKVLEGLHLRFNNIFKIGDKVFKYLESLDEIYLRSNNINKITSFHFAHGTTTRVLLLAENSIKECQLSYLKNLEEFTLYRNNLTHINKAMFAGLIQLRMLNLAENIIEKIDHGAFRDLGNIKFLDLAKNKLTSLSYEMFVGLSQLKSLTLNGNVIHHIAENTFANILSRKGRRKYFLQIVGTRIDLSNNKISDLKWTAFINVSEGMTQNERTIEDLQLLIELVSSGCKRSQCWLKYMIWENIFKYSISAACHEELKIICPAEEKWCEHNDKSTCQTQCEEAGKSGGELVIDGDVCPFQYFCKCTCPSCSQKCALQGKIHIHKDIDKYGCKICNCQCDNNPNCWYKCQGDNFVLKNSTHGCAECECRCLKVNCDANCTEEGLGITKKNEYGCEVCDGCKNGSATGERKTLTYVLLSLVVSIASVSLLPMCLHKRIMKKKHERKEHRFAIFDVLAKNIDPQLAQQVKEIWFNPQTLSVKQLLGHEYFMPVAGYYSGQFGLVWSGTFETLPGRKYPVAIKVSKAEYKNVWTVQTKWNDSHELKPHFEKRPVQMKLENKKIEDFLKEALIMKNFHHPNVLNMLGISLYDEKPCIILPLMCHGDLKKYLAHNKSSVLSQKLIAFALGVAKGMAHLAEKDFVHCDLAARNCLLDVDLVVKISDFGMTKVISDIKRYKLGDTEKPIPIRWMSIESFTKQKFTLQSDVWSFGVVMWEIFSYGQLPYKNIKSTEVMDYLLAGHRLEKPVSCHGNIFEIMLKCWNADPNERPGFDTIVNLINKIADEEADYTEVKDEF